MEIQSAGDFRDYITSLADELDIDSAYSIDEYLRALLGFVYKIRERKPSYDLFAEIFETSLSSATLPFDESWMEWTEPPYINYEPYPDDFDNLLINPETKDVVSKFDVLEKTLFFQIAEQKRMEGIDDLETIGSDNSIGVLSPTGNEWYCFNIIQYLIASVSECIDNTETECDWLTLTDMLEYGRTAQFNN